MSTSTDALLTEMANLVRVKKPVLRLAFDDCVPYLLQAYKQMAFVGDESREVTINEILANLVVPNIDYKCEDKDDLSRQIVSRLWERKIPSGLLEEPHPQTGIPVIVGVVLKLYR